MKLQKQILILCVFTFLLPALLTKSCQALTIEIKMKTVGGVPGGKPPHISSGTGNLQTICRAAADYWESRIEDDHTVTLYCSWAPLSQQHLAIHTLTTQGGTPNREIEGEIVFNRSVATFFIDATPKDVNGDYNTLKQYSNDFGGGELNCGRHYVRALGDARRKIDLFSIALHEIGHALGMSQALTTYLPTVGGDGDIDITHPRSFSGSEFPVAADSAHLKSHIFPVSLLRGAINSDNKRTLISTVDVLINAEVSKFEDLSNSGTCSP